MLWIKEVELVDSVDDLKSSCSVRRIQLPNFAVLDARIASALNRIIQNTQFKRKVSQEEMKAQKRRPFPSWKIYEYFRVTGANDSVENYADLFTVVLRNDDIQEFDSTWDEILLSMTQILSDEIFERLYKFRIRESEKLRTVLELYNMEIHQKKAGPDYHRLKTMVQRSIEHNLRMKNFEATNGNYETSAVVKNQGTIQRGQFFLEIVGNGKPTGSVLKETIAVSDTIWISVQNRHSRIPLRDLLRDRMRKMHREPEVPEAEAQVGKWLDCRARITSKELAPLHSVKNDILQNACSASPKMDAGLVKSALMHIARLTHSLAKGPNRMMTKALWLFFFSKLHDNWVAYFKVWSRQSLHRFYGRAQTYGNQSDV